MVRRPKPGLKTILAHKTPFQNTKTHRSYPLPTSNPPSLDGGYLYVGGDVNQRVDLSESQMRIRALGSTGAHLCMAAEGTQDPCAVLLTKYKRWDAGGGLPICEAAGLLPYDLATGTPVSPTFLAHQGRDDVPVLVCRPEHLEQLSAGLQLRV